MLNRLPARPHQSAAAFPPAVGALSATPSLTDVALHSQQSARHAAREGAMPKGGVCSHTFV